MLKTEIGWGGRPCLCVCDHKCEFAWGVDARRNIDPNGYSPSIDYDDEDDCVYLADDEIMPNPVPMRMRTHSRWCVRDCERSTIIEAGQKVRYPDYSKRHYNQPSKHPEADLDPYIYTGEIYQPE